MDDWQNLRAVTAQMERGVVLNEPPGVKSHRARARDFRMFQVGKPLVGEPARALRYRVDWKPLTERSPLRRRSCGSQLSSARRLVCRRVCKTRPVPASWETRSMQWPGPPFGSRLKPGGVRSAGGPYAVHRQRSSGARGVVFTGGCGRRRLQ